MAELTNEEVEQHVATVEKLYWIGDDEKGNALRALIVHTRKTLWNTRALSAPAPQQPEQQELIARLHKAIERSDNERPECYAVPTSLLEEAAEALSRSHEDGRMAGLEEAAKVLHGMGDSAYCAAMEKSKDDLCLGEEAKLKTGKFSSENLKALEDVRAKFGEATGLWNGEKAIRALKTPKGGA